MKPKGYSRLFISTTAIIAVAFATPSTFADSATWNGTTSATWADASNWTGPPVTAPGAGEIATFDNAGNGNTILDLGAGVTLGSLVFDTASAAAYTIGSGAVGSQTLTLGTTGNAITMNSSVANHQLSNANLALTVTRTAATPSTYYAVTNNSLTNALTLAGGISASTAGVKVLNVTGSGNTAISGAITSGTGNMSLFKTGTGMLTLSGGGTFSGNGVTDGANFASSAVFREGTTILNEGAYNNSNGELVIGGVATHGGVGTNSTLQLDNAASLGSGTTAVISWLSIGRGNGNGSVTSNLTLNDSSSVTSTNLSAGYNAGNALNIPKGTITLNGTSILSVTNTVNFAESAGSDFTMNINDSATFRQTANANQTRVGMSDGTVGVINVNGGTATFERDFVLGYGGTGSGKLVLNSGTVNVALGTERWLKLNDSATAATGRIDVNGGNLNLNTNTDIRFSTNGNASGTNVINLNPGGAITGYTGNNNGVFSGTSVVDLNQGSNQAGVNNTFNLNGGTLTIGQVITNNDSGTAAFNFNGGTLKATGNTANFVNLGGATQTANILTGGAIIHSNSYDIGIPQALLSPGSDGGLTKQGDGNLTLGGTNTYTGATLVSTGTLTLANSGDINTSSSVTVNGSGAKLVQANFLPITTPVTLTQGLLDGNGSIASVTVANASGNSITAGAGTAGTLSVGTLNFQGAAALNLRATGSTPDQSIAVTDLTTSASGDVVINATNASSVWTNGTYPLVTYSTFNGDIAHFSVGDISGLIGNQTASLVDSGFSIDLVIEGESLIWTGTGSANWTTGGSSNWSFEGNPISFTASSPVVFNDNAETFTVNISAANVSPSAVIFENSNDYTINGPFGISGGSLVLNGTGRVTLASPNTYTGSTIINAGILEIAGNGTIASSSSITVNNASLIFNLVGNHTYSNPIAGAGPITKLGAGALTLSGANTFTGDFTLEAGVLNLNSPGALGAGPGIITLNSGTLDNTSGATVLMTPNKDQAWNTDITFLGTNDLFMSNGGITISGPCTVDVQAGTFGAGAITDFGAGFDLIKTGVGTLVLNGTNNLFAGNLDIQNGIVGASQDIFAAAPIGTGTLQNSGAVGTKWTFWTGNTAQASNVLIRNNDGSNLFQLAIVKRGTGSLTLTNSLNEATANLSVDSGRLVLNGTGTYGARNDDGTTNTGLTAVVGNTGGANGELEINGATVNYNNRSNAATDVWRSSLTIGNNGTGAGALKFTSGTLTTDKQLALGGAAGASAGYTQTGGTATIGGFLAIGLGTASGTFNLSGGNFTLTTGPVTNGAGAGSLGVMNLSGDAVYDHNSPANSAIWLGENGSGTLNVSGNAALNIPNNGIELGKLSAATSSGTLNLLGGNVTTNSVSKPGALATGIVNFNGGSLTANVASTTFLGGLTSAYVHSGGGTVDNGGNAISIGQALLAPTGNGVATAASASGSGYITTPVVTVTGDGSGATAVANIDGSGNLLGISITNPGVGYTTPPTFALIGGGIGNTGLVTGTATLAANTSGGLTFSGTGVTALSGLNTYTGNTTVGTGTTLALADNATLHFAPKAPGVTNKVTGPGTSEIHGDFTIDLTAATGGDGSTWTLVDTTSNSFDPLTFTVTGFTEIGNTGVHELVEGNKTWTFTESNAELSLEVGVLSGFDLWITGFGLAAADQDPTDDPDNDGFNNLMEYVLGGNPNSSGTSIMPTGSKSGTDYIFTFKRSDLSLTAGDATIILTYGNNLAGWAEVTVPAASSTVGGVSFAVTDGSPSDTVTATIPNAAATKFFARLKVVK